MADRPGRAYRCGVLTLSDKGSRGEREDTSGRLLQEMLQAAWPGRTVETINLGTTAVASFPPARRQKPR